LTNLLDQLLKSDSFSPLPSPPTNLASNTKLSEDVSCSVQDNAVHIFVLCSSQSDFSYTILDGAPPIYFENQASTRLHASVRA
jgi:hypothetical protein